MESVASMAEEDRVVGCRVGSMEGRRWTVFPSPSSPVVLARFKVVWRQEIRLDVGVEPAYCPPCSWHTRRWAEGLSQTGWEMSCDKLPTFTTARPRDYPGRKPAGLLHCHPHEVERWSNDAHRPPRINMWKLPPTENTRSQASCRGGTWGHFGFP